MNPDRHAVISILVGTVFGLLLAPDRVLELAFVAFVAGTLIDVDHFFIARWRHGDWRYLKTTFSSFWISLHDVQSVLDDEEDIDATERLFTHMLVLVVLVSTAFATSDVVWQVAALSVSVHLLSDTYADNFTNDG